MKCARAVSGETASSNKSSPHTESTFSLGKATPVSRSRGYIFWHEFVGFVAGV